MDVENEKAVYTGACFGAAAEPIERTPEVLEKDDVPWANFSLQ